MEKNKHIKAKRAAALCALLLMISLLFGCGSTTVAATATATAAPTETPEPTATPEPTPEPTPTPETPATRAAALGLPEPPDIDITEEQYMYVSHDVGLGYWYSTTIENVEGQTMSSCAAQPTRDFLSAAREAGYKVWLSVAYRSSDWCLSKFDAKIAQYGSSYEAAKYIDPPGTSEHSSGLAFDITDEQNYTYNYDADAYDETVADTEVYQWMAEHCQEYGFIVRYPEGKEEYFNRACHPGHFRYVGVEAATYIMENNLCLEEFLALYE